jgi:hypothetical protein
MPLFNHLHLLRALSLEDEERGYRNSVVGRVRSTLCAPVSRSQGGQFEVGLALDCGLQFSFHLFYLLLFYAFLK